MIPKRKLARRAAGERQRPGTIDREIVVNTQPPCDSTFDAAVEFLAKH
jgi:hypothetical protein